MFKKIIVLSAFFLAISAAFTEDKNPPSIKLEFQFSPQENASKNFLKYKTSSKKFTDSYDAVSGASKKHSTKELRSAFTDNSERNWYAPKGLRALLLFAVSPEKYLESDKPEITVDGKKITISFTHREIQYKVISDDKGQIHVPDSFFIKKNQSDSTSPEVLPEPPKEPATEKTEAVSEPKAETIPASSEAEQSAEISKEQTPEITDLESTVPENKVPETTDLIPLPDGFEKDAPPEYETRYTGKLNSTFFNGTLRLKGTVKFVPKKIDG